LDISLFASETLAPLLKPLAEDAAERLELAPVLPERLLICLDDIEADQRVWFSEVQVDPSGRAGRLLTVYLHPDQFLKDRLDSLSILPAGGIWEPRPRPEARSGKAEFSRAKAEECLFHQFLCLRDLYDGTVRPLELSRSWAEAFQEAWAVTVDGRLRRWRLPGHSVAQRRRRFSRVFSTAGVLLPEHWGIFHRLWDLEPVGHEAIHGLVRQLPELSRRLQ
jgi:hypothetical protein